MSMCYDMSCCSPQLRLYSNNNVFYEALAWELKDVRLPSRVRWHRNSTILPDWKRLQVERLLKEELQDFKNASNPAHDEHSERDCR